MGFFYSFTETLMHSFWQSGLLLLLCSGMAKLNGNMHPLQKRNLFYFALAVQSALSIFTFSMFYAGIRLADFSIISLFNKAPASFLSQYAYLFFYTWLAVAFLKALFVLLQWTGFKKQLAADLIKPSADLKIFTQLKRHHLGIKRNVSLWYSRHISTPITYGFFKPVILLPFSLLNSLSTEEAETIILHELAHIKNRDYLLNWLLLAVEIIYFFNPFIRILADKIRVEREKNCDVQVIHFNYSPLVYAEVLLRIARKKQDLHVFQLAAARRSAQLLQRIRFFSEEQNLYFNKRKPGLIAFPAALLFLLTAFFFLPSKNTQEVNAIAVTPIQIVDIKELPSAPVSTSGYSDISPEVELVTAAGETEPTFEEPVPPMENEQFFTDENIASMPVALQETADSVKEFTYSIETPQGRITQTFRLTLLNGQWQFEPLWMMMEKGPDSLGMRMVGDSIQ